MTERSQYPPAPELAISRWFNTDDSPTLARLIDEPLPSALATATAGTSQPQAAKPMSTTSTTTEEMR